MSRDELDDWRIDALCREVDPERFYPDVGESTKQAKSVCAGCEVRPECLEDALTFPVKEDHGVRGGLSARERMLLRRARRQAAPVVLPLPVIGAPLPVMPDREQEAA